MGTDHARVANATTTFPRGPLLTRIGEELTLTLGVGQERTFTRDCDDLQAIVIDDADLALLERRIMATGNVTPHSSTPWPRC